MRSMIKYADYFDNGLDIINVADTIIGGKLTANVAQDITVPVDAKYVVFGSSGSFYFKEGAGAVIPAGFGATVQEVNPLGRRVTSGSTVSIISSADIHVTLSFYS
jgi:hypothetical protein